MFELKPLSKQGVAAALEKAQRYRLLNEPRLAESICLDIVEVDPENQHALVLLLLSRTDQFRRENGPRVEDARPLLERLESDYEQHYYAGIICERWAEAPLIRNAMGCKPVAYDWLRQAMDWYEKSESLRPTGDEDPILRWNTCVRIIQTYELEPEHVDEFRPMLE